MRPLQAHVTGQPAAGLLLLVILASNACPPGPGHAAAASTARTLSAESGDKKQVPKPQTPPPRHKPATSEEKASSESEESSGCFEDCASNCLDSIFEGLFFRGASEAATPGGVPAIAPAAHPWVVNERGWLVAPNAGDSIVVWASPVTGGQPDIVAGRLPDGAEVMVEEIHAVPDGVELRVRPVDGVEPAGWVSATFVSPARVTAPAPAPLETAPPPGLAPMTPPARWGFQLTVGGGGFIEGDLGAEYDDGGFHAKLHYLHFLPKLWVVGVGGGYWHMKGNPAFDYETPTTLEVPSNSTFQMVDLPLEFGQRYGTREGFRITWLIGPAAYYIHESADLAIYDNTTGDLLSTGTEDVHRWAWGGDWRIEPAWRFPNQLEIGLELNGYVVAWDPKHEASLTSDFTDGPLHGFAIDLVIGFPAP